MFDPSSVIGNKYGKLTIIEYIGMQGFARQYKCKCDCGGETIVLLNNLKRPKKPTRGCGCLGGKYKDGRCSHKLYYVYNGIMKRCYDARYIQYKDYGARGIKCDRKSLKEFSDDMLGYYEDHLEMFGKINTTIERLDNNGNYCKENCVFTTREIQSLNRRTNKNKIDLTLYYEKI